MYRPAATRAKCAVFLGVLIACSVLPFCPVAAQEAGTLDADPARADSRGADTPGAPAVESAKLVTEDAFTVDPGKTEIEMGYTFGGASRAFDESNSLEDRDTLQGQIFTLGATRGLVDGLDAAVFVSWRDVIEDDSGGFADDLGNVIANVKWCLYESPGGRLAVSWLPGFTAFFGDSATGEDMAPGQAYWSVDHLVALTVIHGRFNLSLDAGFFLPVGGERDDDRGALAGDVAVGYQLTRWFQGELELNYSRGIVKGEQDADALAVTAGGIFNLADDFRLDLGVQQTVYGRSTALATLLIANFSVTF